MGNKQNKLRFVESDMNFKIMLDEGVQTELEPSSLQFIVDVARIKDSFETILTRTK